MRLIENSKAPRYFLRAFELPLLLLVVDLFLPLPLLTLLPLRPSLRSLPASISCSYAPRTTFRATLSVSASSRSLGRRVPAAKEPASINALSCSLICLVIDSGRFRLTRTLSFATFLLLRISYAAGVCRDSIQRLMVCQTTCSLRRKRLDHREVVVIEPLGT